MGARVCAQGALGAWAVQDHPWGFEAPEAPSLELAQGTSERSPSVPPCSLCSNQGSPELFPGAASAAEATRQRDNPLLLTR